VPTKSSSKPPPWKDEEAVAEWVDDILLIQEYQEIEQDILREEHGPDGIPASEVFESMERTAVESAKSGNMRPLADLIDPLRRTPLSKGYDRGAFASDRRPRRSWPDT
jgi:hypothetical protein